MNILVTGGAGYIGAHTCKWLRTCGHTPVTLDNLSYGHKHAVKWGPFFQGDIRDQDLVERIINQHQVEAVIHFAGLTLVGESMKDPAKYLDGNFTATKALLQAMVRTPVRRFVFSSTCAVYGIPGTVPISEEENTAPINPYGQSKLEVERLLTQLADREGLSAISLRYFNAAGADAEGQIGEDHNPETHLIPLAIRAVLDPTYTLTINGTDYATPDGTCIRDYVHVTDLARVHLAALEFLNPTRGSHVPLNVGTGEGYSVRQVLDAVERATGKSVKQRVGPRRPGDPERLVANPEKVLRTLKWHPEHSSLQNIVATAVNWHSR